MKRYVFSLLLAAATLPAFAAESEFRSVSDSQAFTVASTSAMRHRLY